MSFRCLNTSLGGFCFNYKDAKPFAVDKSDFVAETGMGKVGCKSGGAAKDRVEAEDV